MGRPRSNVPYPIKGVYHIRFTGDKAATCLNTRNEREANRVAKQLAEKHGKMTPDTARSQVASTVKITSTSPEPSAIVSDGEDALGGWLGNPSEFEGQAPAPVAQEPKPTTSVAPSWEPVSDLPDLPAPKVGLSDTEKARMHGLLSGIVGRVNVLVLGMGVRVFGRIPAEPEPSDMELLNKAWELQLNELLGNQEIKPYILIIAASAGLGIGMYAGGEPLPPKPKKGQPEAQSAPPV